MQLQSPISHHSWPFTPQKFPTLRWEFPARTRHTPGAGSSNGGGSAPDLPTQPHHPLPPWPSKLKKKRKHAPDPQMIQMSPGNPGRRGRGESRERRGPGLLGRPAVRVRRRRHGGIWRGGAIRWQATAIQRGMSCMSPSVNSGMSPPFLRVSGRGVFAGSFLSLEIH